MNGFSKIKNELIVSNLNSNDFRVMCYLIACSNSGKCFPSVETIATRINASKSTVLRSLDNLTKQKYITKANRTIGSGKKTSNLYTINEKYLINDPKEKLHKSQKELVDYNWLEED